MIVLVVAMMMFKVNEQNPHHGIGIDLPKVYHPKEMTGAEREDALIVGVMRDGQIFFRSDRVNAEELPAKIMAALTQGAKREIYIRADARARCKSINPVFDAVRSAGLVNIGILTDQFRVSYVQ